MLGSEFEKYFDNFVELKKYFLGVFSIDTLPRRIKSNFFCICNTSPSNCEGEHWFCIVKVERNCLELFDSLGVNYEKELFYKKSLYFPEKYLTFNITQFQPNSSLNCGYFCLYFLFQRMHNLDLNFDDVLETFFDISETENDKRVVEFCEEIGQD
jgi:hypothetical protein